jgi:hypothetical protein
VLRTATAPMTAREIADALLAGKAPQATCKQTIDLQGAILAALRKRNGGAVTGEGAPARWRLKEPAKAAVYVGGPLRRCSVEKLGDGGDELRGRERLGQKDAVGDTVRGPLVGRSAGHVNNRKRRVDLSGLPSDFPAIHRSLQIDVGHECPIVVSVSPDQGHRFFARSGNGWFETAIAQSVFDQALY